MTGVSGFFDRQREERPRASVYFRDTDPRPQDPASRSHREAMTPDARREYDRLVSQGTNGLGLPSPFARAEDERLIDSLALFLADRLSTEVIDDPDSHNAIAALIRSWRDGRR